MFWNRVVIGETGNYPTVSKQLYPVSCNHCKEPACVKVCPTRASTRREDGVVVIDADKCVGCRYCVVACPYQQRTFYADGKKEYFPGQGLTEYEIIGKELYPLQTGTVVKCNFCTERIEKGLEKGLKPGVDREATPACVIACPTKARYFGDLNDPTSEVSMVIKEKRGFQLHPEYGTDPSVYYVN
jgi:Fe-S-cluster-containing dehydrogenase component